METSFPVKKTMCCPCYRDEGESTFGTEGEFLPYPFPFTSIRVRVEGSG